MKIVLFRHATRSHHDIGDANLNTTGLAQANELPSLVAPHGPLPTPTHLFSSPKKRARQTFQVLSDRLNVPIQVEDGLDERRNNESAREFEKRVRDAFVKVSSLDASAVVYLCSHMDWLETALIQWPTDFSSPHSWAAGEFLIFRVDEGLCISKGGGVISPRRSETN